MSEPKFGRIYPQTERNWHKTGFERSALLENVRRWMDYGVKEFKVDRKQSWRQTRLAPFKTIEPEEAKIAAQGSEERTNRSLESEDAEVEVHLPAQFGTELIIVILYMNDPKARLSSYLILHV